MVDMAKDDNRQLERLKQFWKRFGNIILWIILLVAASFAIWTYWQKQKEGKILEASSNYVQLQNDLQSGLKSETIITEGHDLMQKYPDTVYAKFAGLLIANEYVTQKLYGAAESNLNWVIKDANNDSIKAVAVLRLARIKIATGKAKDAIDILNQYKLPKSYQGLVNMIKAQAYIQLADEKNAYDSLKKAKEAMMGSDKASLNPENEMLAEESKQYIDMQLSNVNVLIKDAKKYKFS